MLKAKIPIEEVVEKLAILIHSENETISMRAIQEYLDRVFGKAQQTVDMSAKVDTKTEKDEIAEHIETLTREEKMLFFDLWNKEKC